VKTVQKIELLLHFLNKLPKEDKRLKGEKSGHSEKHNHFNDPNSSSLKTAFFISVR
jgi:hypothetical protein